MSKKLIYFFLLLPVSFISNAQVTNDSLAKRDAMIEANDTIVPLEEVVVYRHKWSAAEKKEFQLLQNRVYKVYPIAKIAADRLTVLNKNMDKMKTNREKKKYFKIVEDYMENEFTGQLKKLSRKQGQILVKLIHRQTGYTTFELIKDYKSGWKAFWSNNTARLFDINLKTKYAPYEVNEDFLIESILDRAFVRGSLVNQKPANPVDIDELYDYWEKKAKELKK
ncbi:DUF4294 domain-containing protein [Flavobacterium paronense]|uniref:DUF4294 domain-containing protein n=1 Tax=Flavobacterium paronense TaxID=1392775 RepID=A0ABV5GDB3_9FLAO|nr:DUF4294 domain-containing protein [Flavobacterium paronense]MDN3677778.1 DUF4294 domain-containing protein [Flavobacterium paronense]